MAHIRRETSFIGTSRGTMRSFFVVWGFLGLLACFVASKELKSSLVGPVEEDTVEGRNLVLENINWRKVVMNHKRYQKDTGDSRFAGDTLAYVTPWNNHGYDVAKWFNNKFTYISPTWFNLEPTVRADDAKKSGGGTPDIVWKVAGQHDIDQGWITDVRSPASSNRSGDGAFTAPKIVPRLHIDPRTVNMLLSSQDSSHYDQITKKVVAVVKKNNFDGIVLDMTYARQARERIRVLVKTLADGLHAINTQFIFVVPPARQMQQGQVHGFFKDDFEVFSSFVDRFSLMTYDFSPANQPGPNAPRSWVLSSVTSMLPPKTRGKANKKVLVGLNFYGYDFKLPNGPAEPIIGSSLVQLIEEKKPKSFVWDESTAEHKFQYVHDDGSRHEVYYPSLKSIRDRLDLIQTLGCGVSIWEIGQGLDYFYDML